MSNPIEIYCQFCGTGKTTLIDMKIHLLRECETFHITKQCCIEGECTNFGKPVARFCGCNKLGGSI